MTMMALSTYDLPTFAEFISLMQWLDPRIAHQVTGTAALTGLPLTEVPAQKPGVITSYSIHYTKLYEGFSSIPRR